MATTAIDHINIIVSDLMVSTKFYSEVLGLERRDPPSPHCAEELQWMYDEAGRPLIHLRVRHERTEHGTGTIDHIAFACRDYAAVNSMLEERGISYTTDQIASIGLRQIRLIDPDGVELELNFARG